MKIKDTEWQYLGDAVYARGEAGMITLRLYNHQDDSTDICLDESILIILLREMTEDG